MSLAIFDLDNTLIAADSDYLWGEFLVEQGVVDGEFYRRENQRFYDEYKLGQLDIHEFLRFSLRPLAENSLPQLHQWREQFFREKITPQLLPKAEALLQHHRLQGDTLLIITATNRFVTTPIANAYRVEHMLATEPEQSSGHYTGGVAGTPCFQEGKVIRLHQWLQGRSEGMEGSYFYSDSHNDLPLLELVAHPVVVDGDERLREIASQRGWQQISLR